MAQANQKTYWNWIKRMHKAKLGFSHGPCVTDVEIAKPAFS
jgi:hypothetical protein